MELQCFLLEFHQGATPTIGNELARNSTTARIPSHYNTQRSRLQGKHPETTTKNGQGSRVIVKCGV